MKEPILSREEVDKLANCCFIQSNQLTPHQWRSFAERLEEAWLKKKSCAPSYCDVHCKKFCQNSVHGMCDGPPQQDPLESALLEKRIEAAINTLQAEATDCGCATNEACQMKTDGSCWRAD